MNQEKIGKFIMNLRKEKGLTQSDLAEKLGVTDRSVSNWENGKCMPDISLFKPLCDELEITINELMSGEKITKENYEEKFEQNIVNTISYSDKKIKQKNNSIAIILLVFGFIITLSAIAIFESESSWNSVYSVFGVIISLIGFSRFTKSFDHLKRLVLNFGFFIFFISILFTLDYINVISNNEPPSFSYIKETKDNMIIYKTPFYNVFRINVDTKNEYYIVDTKKEYKDDTVPTTPFNRTKSGIDNIIKYESKYIGDNSNTGNLINNLPLSEFGYVFKIEPDNFHLIINYHITDWYIEDDLYLEKALIYNSVAIFSLIENVQYITYNFTENSFKIERTSMENNYSNYSKIKIDNNISKDNFNKFVENKMNNDEFVKGNFDKLFSK